MARACSADEDTVHYMHTMNWVRDVKGASHLDFILDARDVKQQAEVRECVPGLQHCTKPEHAEHTGVWQLVFARHEAHADQHADQQRFLCHLVVCAFVPCLGELHYLPSKCRRVPATPAKKCYC